MGWMLSCRGRDRPLSATDVAYHAREQGRDSWNINKSLLLRLLYCSSSNGIRNQVIKNHSESWIGRESSVLDVLGVLVTGCCVAK